MEGVRAAVPIRPVVIEYGRVTLTPRAGSEGASTANPVTAPPGRPLAMPERPFVPLPSARRAEIEAVAADLGIALTRVGYVQKGDARLVLLDGSGNAMPVPGGFDHFRAGTA